jgi:hypothetical protein
VVKWQNVVINLVKIGSTKLRTYVNLYHLELKDFTPKYLFSVKNKNKQTIYISITTSLQIRLKRRLVFYLKPFTILRKQLHLILFLPVSHISEPFLDFFFCESPNYGKKQTTLEMYCMADVVLNKQNKNFFF